MKSKLLLTAAAVMLGLQTFAGNTDSSGTNIYKGPAMQRPMMAGIHLGTQGVGAFLRYRPIENLYLRLGVSYLGTSLDRNMEVSDLDAAVVLKGNFTNVHLWGELKPSKWSAFRIVAGVGYFMNAKTEVNIASTGTFKYGDMSVDGASIGTMKATVDWGGIAPYLGAGFFRTMPNNKRIGLNLDYGWYMLSAPKVTIDATKMLAANKANEAQLQENLKGYRWLPALQVNIMYRFK